jgi:MoaA/NifB/PqqE/SkfB family radical SAM enzyme
LRRFKAKDLEGVFPITHFDSYEMPTEKPYYPKVLIFRLSNICNLACVMCSAEFSSRIQVERDGEKLSKFTYPESFFEEIEFLLSHARHTEFYGGEPFLIREQFRVFELILGLPPNRRPTVYVNTNATYLPDRVRHVIEALPLSCLAVSMDGFSAEVHEAIRVGIDHEEFLANLDYLIEVSRSRGFDLILNVTESRLNWKELPEIFSFAQAKKIGVHINQCYYPPHISLYGQPASELSAVAEYLEGRKHELHDARLSAEYSQLILSLSRHCRLDTDRSSPGEG